MAIMKEFRDFAVRGNVIDLAVGVIIGGAFSLIVNSMVKDIVMPLVNFLVGGAVDFSNKFVVLRLPEGYTGPMTYADLTAAGATVFAWGNFLTVVINFILLAFIIFWMVKLINTARKRAEKEEAAKPAAKPAAPPEDVVLLREIRDLLDNRASASAPAGPGASPAGTGTSAPQVGPKV